jgi:WD40 repeat protein
MSNPLEEYRQQQLRRGEEVVQVTRKSDMPKRRVSVKDMADMMDRGGTPGPSPIKPRKKTADAQDVFAILGMAKSKEDIAAEERKAASVKKVASKLVGRLKRNSAPNPIATAGLAAWGGQKRSASPTSPTSPSKVAANAFRNLRLGNDSQGAPPQPQPAASPTASAMLEQLFRPEDVAVQAPDVLTFYKPATAFQPGGTACVAVRLSPGQERVACGYFDGILRIYDLEGKELQHERNCDGSAVTGDQPAPVVERDSGVDSTWSSQPPAALNLRWRPTSTPSIPQPILAATNTAGELVIWDVNRHNMQVAGKVQDEGNEMAALDFTLDGMSIVTAGKNRYVRVYDLELREVATIRGTAATINDNAVMQHTNRVTQLCCHPQRADVVATSSWDCTVQLWDLRCPDKPVRVFDGMFASTGSAIDVSANGQWLLAGNGPNVEFYDIGSGRQLYSTAHHGGSLVRTTSDGAFAQHSGLEIPMHFVQFSKDAGSSTVLTAGGHWDAPCALALRRPDLEGQPVPVATEGLSYGGLKVLGHCATVNGHMSERTTLFRSFDTALDKSRRSSASGMIAAYGTTDGAVCIANLNV